MTRGGAWQVVWDMTLPRTLLLGFLALTGCGRPTEPSLLQVRTTATVISEGAPDSSRIGFTITNASSRPVYLSLCGDQVTVAVERWDGREWTSHSGGFCVLSLYVPPARLDPGQSREGIQRVGARGIFRLRVAGHTDPATEPDWHSTSNRFEVR